MATNVVRFFHNNSVQWGVVLGDRIAPIPGTYETTHDFIESNPIEIVREIASQASPTLRFTDVQVMSPVTVNQQFLCLGANYRQHMIESGLNPDHKSYNMVFTKAPSCISPANTDVVKPSNVKFLDYEIELGIVIKRGLFGATAVTKNNLHEYVAGMVVVNDYSARDIQIPQTQFYKGKSFRTFGPVGPYLCLLERSEMHYLESMELTLTVNGKVRQKDSTANMVWNVSETLSELSSVHDLDVGDLIATGTPAGCALAVPSPLKQRVAAVLPDSTKWRLFNKIQSKRAQYLQPGDLVEASIRSSDAQIDLGLQRNRIVA